MMETTTDRSRTVSRLVELSTALAPKLPDWLLNLRSEGLKSFQRLGFPTRKDESWRYTNLEPIARAEFDPAPAAELAESRAHLTNTLFSNLGCPRLVFVNGYFESTLSDLTGLPEGVQVSSLAESLDADEAALRDHLGRYAGFREEPFSALNLAFAEQGAFVHVAENVVAEKPVELLFLNLGQAGRETMIHPRVLVVAERGAQIRVLESHLGLEGRSYFNNPITELVARENGIIDYYKLQQESGSSSHIGCIDASQERYANVRTTVVTLGGGLVRNNTGTTLNGEGGQADLDGLYLVGEKHHVDNFTRIEHASPRCDSREFYKGILMDQATGVFRGRIVVHKGAQKTDSKQTNQNLLLSDQALINTKPQLEIYADDVKCTHGATIGQLDADSVFYLRSRGLSADAARSILVYAFASEIVNRIRVEPLREALDRYLFEWLPMGKVVKQAF